MASIAPAAPVRASRQVWTGRVLSGIVATFLIMDGGMKLLAPAMVAATTPANLGWPLDAGSIRMLGAVLLASTLLHLWPRTAVLGAILVTGYLGGAVATHVRVGDPLLTHTLFGVYLGAMLWGGLWLRSPQLRRVLLPLGREG